MLNNQRSYFSVGFHVLTAVNMTSTIFRDVTPCSPVEIGPQSGTSEKIELPFLLQQIYKVSATDDAVFRWDLSSSRR
jgi:hypothetical protein